VNVADTRPFNAEGHRLAIVDGYWTPRAARQGTFVMAPLPPREAEALFGELEAMTPSRSALDRLPRELSGRWEAKIVTPLRAEIYSGPYPVRP
jgi:hypothetical protein